MELVREEGGAGGQTRGRMRGLMEEETARKWKCHRNKHRNKHIYRMLIIRACHDAS